METSTVTLSKTADYVKDKLKLSGGIPFGQA